MKNLALAVIAVMKEVKGMEKNSRVGGDKKGSYDGTKDQDVKEVFNEVMANNGLCILPIGIQDEIKVERWMEVDPWSKSTPKDMKSKQSVFTKVTTKYLLLHESGESQEVSGYGHGVDPQDKGAGKATTYALKNLLLYMFLTPVGKIQDAEETHSNDITVPKNEPSELDIATAEIQGCKDLKSLQEIWVSYKGFQKIYSFQQAKDTRKKQLS